MAGAGLVERPLKRGQALAGAADARRAVAGREHHQLAVREVEAGDVLRGEDALQAAGPRGIPAGAGGDPAGAGGLQGILSAEDIAGLDLSDCELVVLSACDSAAGVGRAGQGLASLQRAFHEAGARHVLASLWRVDSERTAEFMTRFYTTLGAEDTTPREALRETRRWMRERRQYTRDWAAWVLSGPAE